MIFAFDGCKEIPEEIGQSSGKFENTQHASEASHT